MFQDKLFCLLLNGWGHHLLGLQAETCEQLIFLCTCYLGFFQVRNVTFHLDIAAWGGNNRQFREVGEDKGQNNRIGHVLVIGETSITQGDGILRAIIEIAQIELALIDILELALQMETGARLAAGT